jgi:DNA-binding HxlR family transcriptional regulator
MSDAAEEFGRTNVIADPGPAAPRSRAGEQALAHLSVPLNGKILRALYQGPMPLGELREATGLPGQTTLRGRLEALLEAGIVAKRPRQKMPYSVEIFLSPAGEGLLKVATGLEAWLRRCPGGAIEDSGIAKGTIKALADGWNSTILHSLAQQPRTLTELDREIDAISYPALERRLSSMRMAGLVEAVPSSRPGTPYTVTRWAREGVRPLAEAALWEQAYLGSRSASAPGLDIEAALLLAVPLADLDRTRSGPCQFEVAPLTAETDEPVGVRIEVKGGEVAACIRGLDPGCSTYASGSIDKWVAAVGEGALTELGFGGDIGLAEDVAIGIHDALMSS